jgi:hypothetical protein
MITSTSSSPTLAREWDQLRASFASSILVDTSLASLAQNLDGLTWPIAGTNETPAAYIDFTFDELQLELSARGHPKAAALLVQILRETLAFDQPFGEMIRQAEAAEHRDNPFLKALDRLGIPESFPVSLCSIDVPARDLCQLEQIETLGQLALFAQRLSQGITLGGDLKRLLNALAHTDERALAELIPFRTGSSGLHLAEALAHAAASAKPVENTATTLAWFDEEFADWRREAATDRGFLARQLAVLDDRAFEETITRLLKPYLGEIDPPKASRWSAFTRWFKK